MIMQNQTFTSDQPYNAADNGERFICYDAVPNLEPIPIADAVDYLLSLDVLVAETKAKLFTGE
jgi:hypothetical protein